jgi:hypothetical protein
VGDPTLAFACDSPFDGFQDYLVSGFCLAIGLRVFYRDKSVLYALTFAKVDYFFAGELSSIIGDDVFW